MTLKFLRAPGLLGGVDETAQRSSVLQPTDLVAATNVVPAGAGRLSLRPNLLAGPTLTDADAVIAAMGLGVKVVFIGWDTSDQEYLVYEWDWSTTPLTGKTFSDSGAPAAKRWSEGISAIVGMCVVNFDNAMFMCATDASRALAYYEVGGTNGEIVPALDLSGGTDAHATPRTLGVYRNHLFIAGYQDEDYPAVPHALRWSKPGVARTASDWVSTDYDYVGVEGIPINTLHPIGDSLLVILKRDSIYGLYGYKSSNFRLREIRRDLGSAGYRAATEYLGAVWFWTNEGKPAVLVGSDVKELDRPIRDTLLEYDYSQADRLWVAPWPQYQCVVFGAPAASIEGVQEPLVYDARDNRWLHKHNFPGADLSTLRKIWAVVTVDRGLAGSAGLPGPAAPPTDLSDDLVKWDSYRSTWINGDNSPGVTTVLERKEDAPEAGSYVDVGTVPVYDPCYWDHSSIEEKHTYTVRARHERNGQSTPVASRPTQATKTRCATAPLSVNDAYQLGEDDWVVVMDVTGRSGRSGAASTIVLQRKLYGGSYATIKTWTDREDAASPTTLQHQDTIPCYQSAQYRSIVTDEAATWPDSEYEYAASYGDCHEGAGA